MPSRLRGWTLMLLALLACGCIFWVPLLVPPRFFCLSASYVAGFNNRLAQIFVGVFALAMVWLGLRGRLGELPRIETIDPPLPRSYFVLAAAVTVLWTCILARIVFLSHWRYLEQGYLVDQLDLFLRYGWRPYHDFEYPYGPILAYAPAAMYFLLKPLHPSLQFAYDVTLLVLQLAGLWFLFFSVDALPLSLRLKRLAFLLFALLNLNLILGLQYTLFRFTIPFFFLALLERSRTAPGRAAAVIGGLVLSFGTSPEIGIAFAAGALVYFLVRSRHSFSRTGVLATIGAVVAVTALAALAFHRYVADLLLFSAGAFNFVLAPVPFVLVFLASVLILAPVAVAAAWRSDSPAAPLLLATFWAGLALVPPALGRVDAAHVSFNGIGLLLLSLVAVSTARSRTRTVWCVLLALLIVDCQAQLFSLFSDRAKHALRYDAFTFGRSGLTQANPAVPANLPLHHGHTREGFPYPQVAAIDLAQLDSMVGDAPVATPLEITLRTEDQLKASGHFVPDRNDFLAAVFDPKSEDAKIDRYRRFRWVLAPADLSVWEETPATSRRPQSFGVNFYYPERQGVYQLGRQIVQDLDRNWTGVARLGPYILFERNDLVRGPVQRVFRNFAADRSADHP